MFPSTGRKNNVVCIGDGSGSEEDATSKALMMISLPVLWPNLKCGILATFAAFNTNHGCHGCGCSEVASEAV